MVAATSSEGFLIVAVVVVVVVVIIIIIIATIIMVYRSSFSDSVRPLYFVHVFKKTCLYSNHFLRRDILILNCVQLYESLSKRLNGKNETVDSD